MYCISRIKIHFEKCRSCLTEILRELFGIESGRHEDEFELGSRGQQVAHDDEEEIRHEIALVNLVDDQVRHAVQRSAVNHTNTILKTLMLPVLC